MCVLQIVFMIIIVNNKFNVMIVSLIFLPLAHSTFHSIAFLMVPQTFTLQDYGIHLTNTQFQIASICKQILSSSFSVNVVFCNLLLTISNYIAIKLQIVAGTGIRGLMRGMATLPQGNQELLVVRDKVGRPPGDLGVSISMECGIFSLQCFDTVGWVTGRASGL